MKFPNGWCLVLCFLEFSLLPLVTFLTVDREEKLLAWYEMLLIKNSDCFIIASEGTRLPSISGTVFGVLHFIFIRKPKYLQTEPGFAIVELCQDKELSCLSVLWIDLPEWAGWLFGLHVLFLFSKPFLFIIQLKVPFFENRAVIHMGRFYFPSSFCNECFLTICVCVHVCVYMYVCASPCSVFLVQRSNIQ